MRLNNHITLKTGAAKSYFLGDFKLRKKAYKKIKFEFTKTANKTILLIVFGTFNR